jgi:uncharacterized membrane protein YedE/YeeE
VDLAVLHDRPAWYVLGPLIGLVVVGLLVTINQRIGVLGGYSNLVERATGRAGSLGWKAWFLFGVVAGGGLFRLLAGSSTVLDGYGWLTRTFSDPTAAALLVAAGGLIGFGAKYAGGCTSGNGIGGTSMGSAASFVATGTFMAVAVGASFALRALT